MVVDFVSQPRFFVGAIIGLAIGGIILTGKKITIGFFGLFLW